MLDRIFPRTIDNSFSGWRAAIWLFALALLIRLTISLNTIFNTRDVAVGADGIPLNTIGAEGAERFLRLFAILGLAQLMPVLIGTLALVRYRAMIPLLYLLLLVEMIGRRLLGRAQPLATSEPTPVGYYIMTGLLGLLAAGFLLSVLPRRNGDR